MGRALHLTCLTTSQVVNVLSRAPLKQRRPRTSLAHFRTHVLSGNHNVSNRSGCRLLLRSLKRPPSSKKRTQPGMGSTWDKQAEWVSLGRGVGEEAWSRSVWAQPARFQCCRSRFLLRHPGCLTLPYTSGCLKMRGAPKRVGSPQFSAQINQT